MNYLLLLSGNQLELSQTRKPRLILWAFFFYSTLISIPALAQPHTCGPGTVTEFGHWFTPNIPALSNSHLSDTIEQIDSAAMKFLIEVDPGTTREWNVVLRDSDFRNLASMGPRDFPGDHPPARWTGLLRANQILVDLIAAPESNIRIRFSHAIAFPANSTGRLFSIVNPSHPWQELYKQTFILAKRAGDAVGMIAGAYNNGQKSASWCCSGVMISADLMLTNWHCGGSPDLAMADDTYWSDEVCANSVIDLNWAKDASSRKYGCVAVPTKNKELDVALIRLGPVLGPDGAIGEPVHARISSKAIQTDGDVFIIHHSQCMQKLVSSACHVKADSVPGWLNPSLDTDFTHNCNTETGASGAPVFDLEGLLVGLHHVGAGEDTPTCRASVGVNKAIKINEIIKFITDNKPDLATELGLINTRAQ
jgi:Trypsin-like peptidase domain